MAYPYIPGSGTDAFKGISVFVGLMISLGSTGIINQVMSGLFVVYSKALKPGEWVLVNDVEGEVLEVGLLAGKIRSPRGARDYHTELGAREHVDQELHPARIS